MVTKRDDDDRPTDDRRQGEYRAICLWKMEWQSFAKCKEKSEKKEKGKEKQKKPNKSEKGRVKQSRAEPIWLHLKEAEKLRRERNQFGESPVCQVQAQAGALSIFGR